MNLVRKTIGSGAVAILLLTSVNVAFAKNNVKPEKFDVIGGDCQADLAKFDFYPRISCQTYNSNLSLYSLNSGNKVKKTIVVVIKPELPVVESTPKPELTPEPTKEKKERECRNNGVNVNSQGHENCSGEHPDNNSNQEHTTNHPNH